MTTFQEVAAHIGQADRLDIDLIFDLCRSRVKTIGKIHAAKVMADLKPGDRVEITEGISPKYLIGATGTVAAQMPSKPGSLPVTLDNSQGRYAAGIPIGVPAACLAKI